LRQGLLNTLDGGVHVGADLLEPTLLMTLVEGVAIHLGNDGDGLADNTSLGLGTTHAS